MRSATGGILLERHATGEDRRIFLSPGGKVTALPTTRGFYNHISEIKKEKNRRSLSARELKRKETEEGENKAIYKVGGHLRENSGIELSST